MQKKMALFLFFFLPCSYAEGIIFGGQGSMPMPMAEVPVELQEAHIIISGENIYSAQMDGSWRYSCDYIFKNTADKTVHVKMALPFSVKHEVNAAAIPNNKKLHIGDPMMYDFNVSVEGKSVSVKKNADNKRVYAWTVDFQPHQILHLHQEYRTGVTLNEVGQLLLTYVLKTGKLWYGQDIRSVLLEIFPRTPTRFCHEVEGEHTFVEWPNMKKEGEKSERKYVLDLGHFSSDKDLRVCLLTGKDYIRYRVVYPLVQGSNSIPLQTITPEQLNVLKNAIYAQYGQHFNDAQMQAFFDSQWWYESNGRYSKHMLSVDDKKALNFLEKFVHTSS